MLENCISSRKVERTLKKVIEKVEEFNEDGRVPFEIVKVGVGGSALRDDNPHDIDVFLWVKIKEGKEKSFREFINFPQYLSPRDITRIYNLKKRSGVRSMKDFVEKYRDELINLGFREEWVEWLKYQRTQSFFVDIGGMYLSMFHKREYVDLRLREGLKGVMKIDFEPFFVNWGEDTLPVSTVIIWENGKTRNVSREECEEHFRREWGALVEEFVRVKLLFWGDGVYLLDEEEKRPYAYTLGFYYYEEGWRLHISREIKRYVDYLIEEGERIRGSDLDLKERNKQLRKILKKIMIVGRIAYAIIESRKLRNALAFGEVVGEKEIREYALKNASKINAPRDYILEVLGEADFMRAVEDIKEKLVYKEVIM